MSIAGKKISELDVVTDIDLTDVLPVVNGGDTVQITVEDLLASALSQISVATTVDDEDFITITTAANEIEKITLVDFFDSIFSQISVNWNDPLTLSNLGYTGIVSEQLVGENVTFGQVLFLDSADQRWYKANATSNSKMPCTGMALASITGGESGKILLKGYVKNNSWSWTEGTATDKILYTSDSSDGALMQTATSTSTHWSQPIATVYSATIIHFDPSLSIAIVA